jgi:hypothetical protein
MRVLRFAVPASLLLFTLLVLLLNLRENDCYERGSLTPPRGDTVTGEDGTFRRIIPETIAHPCPVCGDCAHPVEILQNRRVFSLRDHDGWYKIFWAGDETYYWDDPPFFAASLRNATARDPRGTWTIRGRLGPPAHGAAPPPSGAPAPGEFLLEYELVVSPSPLPEESPLPAGTPFSPPRTINHFSFYPDVPRLPYLLYFGWRLAWSKVPPLPCPCGKP